MNLAENPRRAYWMFCVTSYWFQRFVTYMQGLFWTQELKFEQSSSDSYKAEIGAEFFKLLCKLLSKQSFLYLKAVFHAWECHNNSLNLSSIKCQSTLLTHTGISLLRVLTSHYLQKGSYIYFREQNICLQCSHWKPFRDLVCCALSEANSLNFLIFCVCIRYA
jgi:hypothetical protein